jgi:hypothetical protein
MVEPDLDQALADQPGLDDAMPEGVALSLSWVRHGGDCFPVLSEDQSQILVALAAVEFPMPSVEKWQGVWPFKSLEGLWLSSWTVALRREAIAGSTGRAVGVVCLTLLSIADAFFHRAVVTGIARRTGEGSML